MEENKNMNAQENLEPEKAPTQEKKTVFQKIKAVPAAIKQKHEEKKAAKAEKSKSKTKLAVGLGIAGLALGALAAGAFASKRCGSDEVYDPDEGPEPGDWVPEDMDNSDSGETSEEEVNEE